MSQGPTIPKFPLLNSSFDQLNNWLRGEENQNIEIDVSPHVPYLDDTFLKNWRKSFLLASSEEDLTSWGYGDVYGFISLREQIQRYLKFERGIHVDIDQIILTSGAHHSIDLIAQALLGEGGTDSVEDPEFPAAWMTMEYRSMNVVPVPVDEYGIQISCIHPQSL